MEVLGLAHLAEEAAVGEVQTAPRQAISTGTRSSCQCLGDLQAVEHQEECNQQAHQRIRIVGRAVSHRSEVNGNTRKVAERTW